MDNPEYISRHFRKIYPNPPKNLSLAFEKIINSSENSGSEGIEKDYLSFLASNLRVAIPEESFSDSLKFFETVKANLKSNTTQINKNIPGFVFKNILTMPKNRGYIWKNQKFFGKMKEILGPTVLFEPRKGKTYIHVYEDNYHKIFEKLKGERRQILISAKKIITNEKKKNIPKVSLEKKAVSEPRTINTFSLLCYSDSESD